jgi:hypothetical protein
LKALFQLFEKEPHGTQLAVKIDQKNRVIYVALQAFPNGFRENTKVLNWKIKLRVAIDDKNW